MKHWQWTRIEGRWADWWVGFDPASGSYYRCGEPRIAVASAAATDSDQRPLWNRRIVSDLQRLRTALMSLLFGRRFLPISGGFIDWINLRAGGMFSRSSVVACLATWVMLLVIAAVQLEELLHSWRAFGDAAYDHPLGMAFMGVVIFVAIKSIHELSHAVACRRAGGRVERWGFNRILLMTLPFVDVSDVWRVGDRSRRIAVAAAGLYAECWLAAAAMAAIFIAGAINLYWLSLAAWQAVLAVAAGSLLFNLNVLMRMDGYYILCELLEVPELATASRDAWRLRWRRAKQSGCAADRSTTDGPASAEVRPQPAYPWWHRWLLRFYAVLAGTYRVFVTIAIAGGILLTASAAGLSDFGWWIVGTLAGVSVLLYILGGHSGWQRSYRLLLVGAAAAAMFVVPIPYRFHALGTAATAGRVPIYAPENVQLVAFSAEGDGFAIDFDDAELTDQLLQGEERLLDERSKLRSSQRAAFQQPAVLGELPTIQQRIAAQEERQARMEGRLRGRHLRESGGWLPVALPPEGGVEPSLPQPIRPGHRAAVTLNDSPSGWRLPAGTLLGYRIGAGVSGECEILVDLPARYRPDVYPGQRVQVLGESDPHAIYDGVVWAIDVQSVEARQGAEASQQLGSDRFAVRVRVPQADLLEDCDAQVVFFGESFTLLELAMRWKRHSGL